MNNPTRDGGSSETRLRKQALVSLSSLILLVVVAWAFLAQKPATSPSTAQPSTSHERQPTSPPSEQTSQQLQQLVAPIALYPDRLVAQILAAAAFPEQIVEADRWMESHPDLTGQAFTEAIDQQPWDSSVKALTAFPAVLGNMDKNLSWTSSLGEAYSDKPGDVLDAVQTMRQRAKEAGTLKTTPQETVATEDSTGTIGIEPADADSVYVPQYNAWQAYGSPVDAYPDWSADPGTWYDGYGCYFGLPYAIAFYNVYPWGWCHWGFDRHHHFVMHDHDRVFSRRGTFNHRGALQGSNSTMASVDSAERGLSARANDTERFPFSGSAGGRSMVVPENLGANFQQRGPSVVAFNNQRAVYNRSSETTNPAVANIPAARGYIAPRRQLVMRSGGFSGPIHGGQVRGPATRSGPSVSGGAARGGVSGGMRR